MNDSHDGSAKGASHETTLMEGAEPNPKAQLIVASASPRREQLLRKAGFKFLIDPANIDEDSMPASLMPAEVARILAGAKAEAVAARHKHDVVLAADTVVAFGDTLLGKPRDADHARQILTLLSGTTHIVITAVVVLHRHENFRRAAAVMSAVRMRDLTPREIDDYVATRLWEGKAGGYGIQDNDPFVTRMTGSHTNIVGLPMEVTVAMLSEAGIAANDENR